MIYFIQQVGSTDPTPSTTTPNPTSSPPPHPTPIPSTHEDPIKMSALLERLEEKLMQGCQKDFK